MQTDVLDFLIIGTGQAGVPLATRLARAGKRVLLVERGQAGGTCTNTGCTPTKTLLASAHAAHHARTAARLGVHVQGVEVRFDEVIRRKNEMVQRWRDGVHRRIREAGERLTFLEGHARFVGERTVEVNGQRYRAERVVLDVGARPVVPDLPGLNDVPWLTNHGVMDLTVLPSHLVILGGGYVGCEFAQMFLRFGAKVTLVSHGARLLGHEDPDVSESLATALQAEGLTLALGASAASVARQGAGVRLKLSSGEVIDGSHLLVATGRRPNTDELGCREGGIALDKRGAIVIDDHYRTGAPGVFAVGDCTPEPQFTHVAWDDHRLLYDVLLDRPSRSRTQRLIPYTLFTEPQLAAVGLNEHQAKARAIPYEVARMAFGAIARSRETDTEAGLIKLLVDPATERFLGAAIVGAEAGELLHVIVALMEAGASARALVSMQCVHPTYAEGLQTALMTLPRFALS